MSTIYWLEVFHAAFRQRSAWLSWESCPLQRRNVWLTTWHPGLSCSCKTKTTYLKRWGAGWCHVSFCEFVFSSQIWCNFKTTKVMCCSILRIRACSCWALDVLLSWYLEFCCCCCCCWQNSDLICKNFPCLVAFLWAPVIAYLDAYTAKISQTSPKEYHT